jgi:hypothetical protein
MFVPKSNVKSLRNPFLNSVRNYAENAPTASTSRVRNAGGNLQLIVPLTTKQQCSFPLRQSQTIRQLIQDIRVEDPSREFVSITDLNGNRYDQYAFTFPHLS